MCEYRGCLWKNNAKVLFNTHFVRGGLGWRLVGDSLRSYGTRFARWFFTRFARGFFTRFARGVIATGITVTGVAITELVFFAEIVFLAD
jgi:hypothetical protein